MSAGVIVQRDGMADRTFGDEFFRPAQWALVCLREYPEVYASVPIETARNMSPADVVRAWQKWDPNGETARRGIFHFVTYNEAAIRSAMRNRRMDREFLDYRGTRTGRGISPEYKQRARYAIERLRDARKVAIARLAGMEAAVLEAVRP